MDTEKPASPVAVRKPRKVPEFDGRDDGSKMNRHQQTFYLDEFLPGLRAGNPVDVQGNSGYAGELLCELMEQRRTEPVEARERLVALIQAYRWQDLPSSVDFALAGFHFLERDFAAGYIAVARWADPSLWLSLVEHLGHPRATAHQAHRWAESGSITVKGLGMYDEVLADLQGRLDDFHDKHGVDMLTDFWRQLTAEGSIDEVAAAIEDDLLLTYTGADVRALLERGRGVDDTRDAPAALDFWQGYEEVIDWPGPWIWAGRYDGLIHARFRGLVRDAENAVREAAGIARVGERWPSEMKLLREIRAAFPGERIVHQARPWWLKPQSLDIYFTDQNVAVEYQGAQHSRPVDFFGGEEAFMDLQQRDLDKLAACAANGCTLIAVHPGYRLEDVVAQVKAAIEGATL